MDTASIYYLGVTFLMFVVFAAIVARTLSGKRKDTAEAPKFRMMDGD